MMPTVVHRYAFPIREAVERMLDDAVYDCLGWQMRVEDGQLVIDVVGPRGDETASDANEPPFDVDEPTQQVNALEEGMVRKGGINREPSRVTTRPPPPAPMRPADGEVVTSPASNETAKSYAADPEPELKGGPLARRAAICCGEKGFWTFLGVDSAETAKADVCRRCGISSRKELDQGGEPAERWREIETKYRLWLGGHDVDID